MTASQAAIETTEFKLIVNRNKSKQADHAADNKADIISAQELDLKTQRDKLLKEHLPSAATFVGACATKSASNESHSRLHNDSIGHQAALAAAEIAISAHDKLPSAPALEFFDIDKRRFLETVLDHVLVECANAQDLVAPIDSLSASASIATDANPLNASIDLAGGMGDAVGSNNETSNIANEPNNASNALNADALPASAPTRAAPIMAAPCRAKRRKFDDNHPQANIGSSLEAARTSNQETMGIESESNANSHESVT